MQSVQFTWRGNQTKERREKALCFPLAVASSTAGGTHDAQKKSSPQLHRRDSKGHQQRAKMTIMTKKITKYEKKKSISCKCKM